MVRHLLLTPHVSLRRDNASNTLLPSVRSTKTMASSWFEYSIQLTHTHVIDAASASEDLEREHRSLPSRMRRVRT
jgi:hypothetical protein